MNSSPDSKFSDLESNFKKKKEKIKELSERITSHSLYKENQDIKQKIKNCEMMSVEASIQNSICEEKAQKKALESQYDSLYQIHQFSSKNITSDLENIKYNIKQKEKESERTINYLKNKLEEQVLDSQLLNDQIKLAPSEVCTQDPDSKRSNTAIKQTKQSNPEIEKEIFDYNQRILTLESELKKTKFKYKQLKKLYLKKCRRTHSIDTKNINTSKSKKSYSKPKINQNIKPAKSSSRRNTTPRMTPHKI